MIATTPEQHPIVACVARAGEAISAVVDLQPVFMSTDDKATALVELTRLEARMAELRLRILATADDLAEATGARDAGAWLAQETRTEHASARADLELATALDRRYQGVAHAMAQGDVSAPQARVIVKAMDDLADTPIDTATRDRAEEQLIRWAEQFRPTQLRRLGRRILEVVDPDAADQEEARRLAAEEEHAARKASLRLRPLGDGTTRITGLLPDPVATRLRTYLDAFASPRQRDGAPADDGRQIPAHRRTAEAFATLLERIDPARLPEHGGDATTLMVTITLDALRTELAAAGILDADLDQGNNLTAGEARRLACTAHILPVVLDGQSQILDLGRSQRLFNAATRKAIRLRDRRCRAEGCTIPAPWTEAHHLQPWSQGGPTNLANAISLCNHHHHRAHDTAYRSERLSNGDVRFFRRI